MASTRPARNRGLTKGQIRADRRKRSARRKSRRRAVLYSLGGLFAAAFIVSLLVPGGLRGRHGGGGGHAGSRINTGGPVPLQPDQGNRHIPVGVRFVGPDGLPAYNTLPATSGSHWGVTPPSAQNPTGAPARWGIYAQELPDEVLVHNLEHGGIAIHYNCPGGCDDLVQQLTDLAPRGFSQFILSPYTNMGSKIAITSWRHILTLDEFDEAQLRDFIDAYLDRAPESVPGNLF